MKSQSAKNSIRHELMSDFAKRIRYTMSIRDLNQSYLARSIGITQPEISNYCRAKNYPRLWVIQKLAFKLEVNYNWLKTGIGTYELNTEKNPDSEFHSTFSERLIWLIWTNNLTPKQLAQEIGLPSSTTITYWCEGQRSPNENNFHLLCKYFNVTKEWLEPKPDELPFQYDKAKEMGLSRSEYLAWFEKYH